MRGRSGRRGRVEAGIKAEAAPSVSGIMQDADLQYFVSAEGDNGGESLEASLGSF